MSFPLKYIHRFDHEKKIEGIRSLGFGDQFAQRWGLGQNLGGITHGQILGQHKIIEFLLSNLSDFFLVGGSESS